MQIKNDIAISVRDGLELRANIYMPDVPGRYPVILTHGPYGKDVHFADAYSKPWARLKELCPTVDSEGTSGQYLRWELPDPERWIPHGYAVVAVDSRGSGKSPGELDVWSPQQVEDYYDCIEWAGVQPWSNGRVGLMGISYLAVNQWQVAALNPPHLAAIMPWEGFCDFYRELTHHGGMLADYFVKDWWWPQQILTLQHGNGETPFRDRATGAPTTGAARKREELVGDRSDFFEQYRAHSFDDGWHRDRTPDLSKIRVPLLSAGNWGGLGLHLRGNVEGYLGAASTEKWLELHGGTHYESFYHPSWFEVQKQFFDCYLKQQANGWCDRPRVMLHVRHVDGFRYREEHEWPIARTNWTQLHLCSQKRTLQSQASGETSFVQYDPLIDRVDFCSETFSDACEITGPIAAKLWVRTTAKDADFFVTLRLLDDAGNEVTFEGASEPAVPVTQGWLRLSAREIDGARSSVGRPFHIHRRSLPVEPDKTYAVEIELWATSIVVPRGYRLSLVIEGRDYSRSEQRHPRTGSGPFLHNDPVDREPERFAGAVHIYTGGAFDSHLMLPVVPARSASDASTAPEELT